MRSKTKSLLLIVLVITGLLSSLINDRYRKNGTTNRIYLEFNEKNQIRINPSGFWNLTGSTISIDDSDPSKNWSYTASIYDWCSGSGIWTDPYIIENVTIDAHSRIVPLSLIHSYSLYFQKNYC